MSVMLIYLSRTCSLTSLKQVFFAVWNQCPLLVHFCISFAVDICIKYSTLVYWIFRYMVVSKQKRSLIKYMVCNNGKSQKHLVNTPI